MSLPGAEVAVQKLPFKTQFLECELVSHFEEGGRCAICFDSDVQLITTGDGCRCRRQLYCRPCLLEWFKQSNNCPTGCGRLFEDDPTEGYWIAYAERLIHAKGYSVQGAIDAAAQAESMWRMLYG